MLEYGNAFIEQNERAIEALKSTMSPAAAAIALEMAPEQDDTFDDDEDLERVA